MTQKAVEGSELHRAANNFLAIVGPTASGKSALAMALAARHQGEIICCDSVQFYQGFNIGSAKPTAAEQAAIPHHLFGIIDADQTYTAGDFRRAARVLIRDIRGRGGLPILVGGTGLYLRALIGKDWHDLPASEPVLFKKLDQKSNGKLLALLRRLDPGRAAELHPNDRVRLLRALELRILTARTFADLTKSKPEDELPGLITVLQPERAWLHQRINTRALTMLEAGLIEEVNGLLAAGVSAEAKPMQSIGYKEVLDYIKESLAREDLAEAMSIATRQYAKRQDTWFRSIAADLRLSASLDTKESLQQALQKISAML